ncbi:MAG: N-acetylneuraminate synthase [Epulopiscium sp. Nele67-Bin005]|nr:MAG: N-acetylneuraminate synthase [Epulopiscium sp. Nele67-Bin005]
MNKTFIIAEVGVNHNGNIELAKKLIDVATEAGADAVKFQTFKTEKLVSATAQKAEYQKQTTDIDESQFDMIKKLELDLETHHALIDYCAKKKIMFLSSPFDLESVVLLDELGLQIFKIPSGEITNLPYLEQIAKTNKELILSTGMCNLGEIEQALNVLRKYNSNKITILHCNTEYPTPMEDVNLRAMLTIKEAFKCEVGYSDHTLGVEVAISAVALGAVMIEKHITLDKTMEGPDHRASLEPAELKSMVLAIRNIEKALGTGIKQPSKSETKNIEIARKSIVASKFIQEGEKFTEENLTAKRPATGISPMSWYDIIGKVATKNYEEDEIIL